ncbi:diguanylate cyclase [Coralloluteibacterium stylophorae]|uniref:diguanylate cyclase n=1 Tax=Coralloluteibacterium stylophorae TaxID=1776034 RepID=A0A8J7VSZ1_9GAMM|nr:diguanylate cyclase [Coralloluteibacterium stylophorae]MBS7458158.1 diguanylate cyclase [Coralloluteibacterium stylophorae]
MTPGFPPIPLRPGAPSARPADARVLLVENSRMFSEVLATALRERLGVEVVTAGSLAQARRALAEQGPFFLVLTGLVLADGDQSAVVETFVGQGLPTVIVTGVFDEAVRQRLLGRSIVDYVLKDTPGAVDYLVWLVQRLERNRRITALVVDDSPSARQLAGALLGLYGFHVRAAASGAEALAALARDPSIRLVIADYEMPGMSGIEFLRRLRTRRARDSVAVIGVSGSNHSSLVAEFLKSGANDFLHKPFSREEFFCRISQNVDSLELIGSLQDLATRDFLTGLANRRHLFERGGALIQEARQRGEPVALAMLDIDFFKRVNDGYGHDCGDMVIRAVAEAVDGHARAGDVAARFGGEEFCVLAPGLEGELAEIFFDALRARIEALALRFEEHEVAVTISVGVVTATRGTLNEMLLEADRRLYLAKAAGRNRVVAAGASDEAAA